MSSPDQRAAATPSAAPHSRTLGGTLAKTPMPRLLMSASSARVTGTLELSGEGGEGASVVMVRGLVTKVKTTAPVAYLGVVLYELGYIDTDVLNDSLRELSRMKWLHGEILLTRAAISAAQLAEGLHEQTTRKLFHLFSLPPETRYSFEADVDRLESWGGGDWPHVDPSIAVWRGVREGFAAEDIEAAMARSKNAFRLATAANPRKFDMTDVELSAAEAIRGRALTIDELAGQVAIDPKKARELVYFLVVTKQAESLETSGVRPAYRPPTSTAPAAPPVESVRPRESIPSQPTPSARPAFSRPSTPGYSFPISSSGIPAAPHTKPTVREMPAVGSAPRISVAPERASSPPQTESARWRAVAPAAGYSSARIPVATISHPAESATVPVARASSAPVPASPASSPPRSATMGGVTSTVSQVRRLSPPPIPVSSSSASTPPPIPVSARSASFASAAPSAGPVRHASTGQFNAKAVAELASRRQSIFERARAILKEDYFQRLSLPRDAKPDQVESAFMALRTLWDPTFLPPALEEAKDDSAFVMSCLAEAYSTLRIPGMRDEYIRQLTTAALRAPSDQLAEDLAASGASDPFEGASACFARGDNDRAERLARRAVKADPEAAGALALLAWLEAMKPANVSPEETKKRIAMLDRAVRLDETMANAFYWRGLLHKRIDNHNAAMSSFKKVVELAPKNMDAVRELRVYEMRIRRNSLSMKAVK